MMRNQPVAPLVQFADLRGWPVDVPGMREGTSVMRVPTVRLWVYMGNHGKYNDKCGMVRITLKPGEEVVHERGGPTDEGCFTTWWIYRHEGDHISFTAASDGRDCDGRFSEETVFVCSIWEAMWPTPGNVPTRTGRTEEVPFIRWKEVGRHQRDYQAEAAGY